MIHVYSVLLGLLIIAIIVGIIILWLEKPEILAITFVVFSGLLVSYFIGGSILGVIN